SSGSVAPSYPRAQNTSSARPSASSASNCRVRPEGMTLSQRGRPATRERDALGPVRFIVPNDTDNFQWEMTMSAKLDGKVAVVTGASKGIGGRDRPALGGPGRGGGQLRLEPGRSRQGRRRHPRGGREGRRPAGRRGEGRRCETAVRR